MSGPELRCRRCNWVQNQFCTLRGCKVQNTYKVLHLHLTPIIWCQGDFFNLHQWRGTLAPYVDV